MAEKGINGITNFRIVNIEADKVSLADSRQFLFKYSMILPSFRGVNFLLKIPRDVGIPWF